MPINLIEIFDPYIPFITFSITIIINLFMLFKRVPWYSLIIGNLIITLIMNFLGLGSYDLLSQLVHQIGNILVSLFSELFTAIGKALNPFN